jgi:putative ABC transport system permease protein
VAAGLQRLHHGSDPLRTRARRVLVALQLAGSLPLLALSGLAGQALLRQQPALPPNADRVLLTGFALADVRSTPARPGPFVEAVLERLHDEPSVESAAFSTFGLHGQGLRYWRGDDASGLPRHASGGYVTHAWFAATSARFLAGRPPNPRTAGGPAETVVNATLARALGRDVTGTLGSVLRLPSATDASVVEPVSIVGVMADIETSPDGEAVPMIVRPMPLDAFPTLVLVAKARDVTRARRAVQLAVAAADPAVPVGRVQSFAGLADEQRYSARALVTLGLVFGGLALALAALGLYALMAYTVRRRAREVGIRLSLGARRQDILWLIVRQAVALVALGLLAGLIVAAPLATLMRSVLVGITAFEPWALLPAIAVLFVVSLVATAGPAFRAASVDPVKTLRRD